jgi:hypothetical protein
MDAIRAGDLGTNLCTHVSSSEMVCVTFQFAVCMRAVDAMQWGKQMPKGERLHVSVALYGLFFEG